MRFGKFRCFYSYEDYHKKYSKNLKKALTRGCRFDIITKLSQTRATQKNLIRQFEECFRVKERIDFLFF